MTEKFAFSARLSPRHSLHELTSVQQYMKRHIIAEMAERLELDKIYTFRLSEIFKEPEYRPFDDVGLTIYAELGEAECMDYRYIQAAPMGYYDQPCFLPFPEAFMHEPADIKPNVTYGFGMPQFDSQPTDLYLDTSENHLYVWDSDWQIVEPKRIKVASKRKMWYDYLYEWIYR